MSTDGAKYKKEALTGLQLAPSSSLPDNVQLHPISLLHKHWPKGSETDMWIYKESLKHKHYYGGWFSRQNGKLYLRRAASCFAFFNGSTVAIVTILCGGKRKKYVYVSTHEKFLFLF